MVIPHMRVEASCLHVVGPEPSGTPEKSGVEAIYPKRKGPTRGPSQIIPKD